MSLLPLVAASLQSPLHQAADLVYCDRPGGGERHVGQLIDRLAARECLHREALDGGPARIRLYIPQGLKPREASCHSIKLNTDAFDLELDETYVSEFVTGIYDWVNPETPAPSFNVLQTLRQWAALFSTGLRVLRNEETQEPVGFAAFFPVHPESEEQLHLSPSSGLHLITISGQDPFQAAIAGDEQCYSIFVRSWMLEKQYWNYSYVCQFLKDSQATLTEMKEAFPNIRNLHTISIHPALDKLALQVGFKMMDRHTPSNQGSDGRLWLRMSLKKFLNLDIDEAMADFDFSISEFT